MVLSEGLKTSLLFIDVTVGLSNVNAENPAHPVMDTVLCHCCIRYCMCVLCVNAFICVVLCVSSMSVYVCMSTDHR